MQDSDLARIINKCYRDVDRKESLKITISIIGSFPGTRSARISIQISNSDSENFRILNRFHAALIILAKSLLNFINIIKENRKMAIWINIFYDFIGK